MHLILVLFKDLPQFNSGISYDGRNSIPNTNKIIVAGVRVYLTTMGRDAS